jgi:hypothetical protein
MFLSLFYHIAAGAEAQEVPFGKDWRTILALRRE